METKERRFISPEEFGRVADLSGKQVRILLAEGRLPGLRMGRLWRVDLAGIEQLLNREVAASRD